MHLLYQHTRISELGKTYSVLTAQIEMSQNLLIHRQPLLMHPWRNPLLLFPNPILPYLRIGNLCSLLLHLAATLGLGSGGLLSDRKGSWTLYRRLGLYLFGFGLWGVDFCGDGFREVILGGFGELFGLGGDGWFGDFVRVGSEGEGLLSADAGVGGFAAAWRHFGVCMNGEVLGIEIVGVWLRGLSDGFWTFNNDVGASVGGVTRADTR